MIAVTCRNGEHFSLNPDLIQRVENRGDTWVFLADGTKYVVGQSIEELARIVTHHRAAAMSSRRLLGRPAPVAHLAPELSTTPD